MPDANKENTLNQVSLHWNLKKKKYVLKKRIMPVKVLSAIILYSDGD